LYCLEATSQRETDRSTEALWFFADKSQVIAPALKNCLKSLQVLRTTEMSRQPHSPNASAIACGSKLKPL